MAWTEQELDRLVELAKREMLAKTGRVFCVPKSANRLDYFGGGSCVYVESRKRRFAVSCEHVTRDAAEVLTAIPATEDPNSPRESTRKLTSVPVLREDAQSDLAILDVSRCDLVAAKKHLYPLESSDPIDQDWAKQNLPGLSAFMCGGWADQTEIFPLGNDDFFVYGTPYAAGGPIIEVTETSIVAEFKEDREMLRNVKEFPDLADVTISGGSRDLKGTSGSGLWIVGDGHCRLAGILKGPASGLPGDPKIRFTPVWALRKLFEDLPQVVTTTSAD
jgi:hypothetical protein